jgi:hypothetical protein
MYTAKDMRHEDFQVGIEFWCSSRRWRCTDIGTRVVVGVCLEPHEVVTVARDAQTSSRTETRTITADESWLAGPPYAVPEAVFDEYSIGGCSLIRDGDGSEASTGPSSRR